MVKERIDVFISSTSIDLPDYRQVAVDAILEVNFQPVGMERWSVTGEDPVNVCKRKVEQAEIYLGIFAHRYGWRPDGYDNKSITELEYDWAEHVIWQGKPIPRLCFILNDEYPWPADRYETEAEEDLKRFKQRIQANHIGFFTTPENLKAQIVTALANIKTERQLVDKLVWEPNEWVDKYILRRELGQGGNGQVWMAEEPLPLGASRPVAIKVLKEKIADDEQRVKRFKREISIMARINHPHIVPIWTYGERDSQLYVVMRYLEGGTLREQLTGEPLSLEDALQWLEQIGQALDYVHDRHDKLIHRDVKPENMLIDQDRKTLYLADFGLVFSDDSMDLESGEQRPVGTGRYMSPEQWENKPLSRQTDLYAMGILAYELLTGELPYSARNDFLLAKSHCEDMLPRHPSVPDEILRILWRATEHDPASRYTTAREFLNDLRNWDKNPVSVSPKIEGYLKWLTGDIHDRILNRFVELSADETHHDRTQLARPKPFRVHPFEEDDYWEQATTTIHANHISPQQVPSFVENVRERLMRLNKAVLIGEPGSGKSFMLMRLSIDYMQAWTKAYKEGDASQAKVPVLVYLNEYNGGSFVDFVRQSMDFLAPYHDKLLREGRLVILCDALNEMPRKNHQMEHLITYLRNIDHFVVSCRVRDYQDELKDLKPLEQIKLHDLELPAIHKLINKRLSYEELGDTLWQEMGGSRNLLELWEQLRRRRIVDKFWDANADIPQLRGELEEAWRKIHTGARLIPLARNPYMADMLCRTYRKSNGHLPANRAELFALFISQMLVREAKGANRRGEAFPQMVEIEKALTELARVLQDSKRTVMPADDARDVMTSEMLLKAATDANILSMEGDTVKFAHQLLQEYFAARVLLEKMQADEFAGTHDRAAQLFDTSWWDAGVWRETSIILGEFLGDGTRSANRVARWFAPVSPEVALQVITRNGAGFTIKDVEPETRALLIEGALKRRDEPHPFGRASAYRVLGLLSADQRKGARVIRVKEIDVPDIVWCGVPAGEFTMGSDRSVDTRAYEDETPQTKVNLQSYWIARNGITNHQYQAFIDDGGYDNKAYWTDAGWDAKNERHWKGPEYNGDKAIFNVSNQSVMCISWYEAYAFTRWLNERLHTHLADTLPLRDDYEIRLPTETEWEKASRGVDGRIYPYGNIFDKTKSNTFEMGIRQPTAVGIFSQGASPYGVLDMSGNVYDWCLSRWRDTYNDPEDNDPQGTFRRVIRSGAFANGSFNARCAYRYHNVPRVRGNYYGIRCVYAPKVSELTT